jgi:hypothetical protein
VNRVRCKTCGRAGLPVVPGTVGGNGTLAYPVAHVNMAYLEEHPHSGADIEPTPCHAGVNRRDLEEASENAVILEWKRMIWNDDAFWEL